MQQLKTAVHSTTETPAFSSLFAWKLSFWLVLGVSTLVYWPLCLDLYLAPRFFSLAFSLLIAGFLLRKSLYAQADWRMHGFDFWMLGWYVFNTASIFWAYSWSEAVFYSQKTGLLLLVYWLVRQGFEIQEGVVRKTLRQLVTVLGSVASVIVLAQISWAFSEQGLDNDTLYKYANGVFGNKSLTTDFLCLVLFLHFLLWKDLKLKFVRPTLACTLILLILVLQTRTVYLALVAGILFYGVARAFTDPAFRPVFLKRILPIGLLFGAILVVFLQWKGGGSVVERLNPANYLESASANERRFVWYKTNVLNADHYWWGVGDGSWKLWFPSKNIEGGFRLQEQNVVFTRAHNDYLEVRAELGITGAFWFCALFGLAFLSGILVLRTEQTQTQRNEILWLLSGLLAYCVIQYFDFPRERPELQAMLGLMLGWLAWRTKGFWQKGPGMVVGTGRKLGGYAAAVVLVFCLTIGWYRIQGEMHNVSMLKAQVAKNYAKMATEAALAANVFYEYDDVALPMPYHEGLALAHLNQTSEAEDAFEMAYWMNPWSFLVTNNYATALARAGKMDEAIPLFEKTVAINPKSDEGKSNLAYLYMKKGDSEKAMAWYHKIDTIVKPQTEQDRLKNEQIKSLQSELLKILQDLRK